MVKLTKKFFDQCNGLSHLKFLGLYADNEFHLSFSLQKHYNSCYRTVKSERNKKIPAQAIRTSRQEEIEKTLRSTITWASPFYSLCIGKNIKSRTLKFSLNNFTLN